MKKTWIKEIKSCSDCDMCKDAADGAFCSHSDFPRNKKGKIPNMNADVDIYEEIHDLCPEIKR